MRDIDNEVLKRMIANGLLYEFVLTDKMKEDRFICNKGVNICKECSCRMGKDDCVFNHLKFKGRK